eukprot:13725822-Ditylum_brightwellii.AAC.1
MASLFGSQLVILIFRVLNRSVTHDTLDTLITGRDGQLLEVAHQMHVVIALLHCHINLVLDKRIEIFDLFGAQAMLLDMPLSIINKVDLPEPLLFCDMMSGLNILPVSLIIVALFCVTVTKPK